MTFQGKVTRYKRSVSNIFVSYGRKNDPLKKRLGHADNVGNKVKDGVIVEHRRRGAVRL